MPRSWCANGPDVRDRAPTTNLVIDPILDEIVQRYAIGKADRSDTLADETRKISPTPGKKGFPKAARGPRESELSFLPPVARA